MFLSLSFVLHVDVAIAMPSKKKRGFRHVSKPIATNFGYRNPRLSESYMD